MSKKLCYVVRSLKAAGAEKYVLDLATYFSANHDVMIISLGINDVDFVRKYNLGKTRIIRICITELFSLKTLIAVVNLCLIFLKERFDLVHTNMFTPDILGGLAAVLTGTLFISTQHDTQVWRYSKSYRNTIRRYLHRFLMKFCAVVITPTHSVKQYLIDTEQIDQRKIQTIYHGIDLEKFDIPIRAIDQTINIGVLARFRPEKGHEYIIRALPEVLTETKPLKIKILFAGDGNTKTSMEDLAITLGLEKNIEFLGHIYDVPHFLTKIDILLHAAISSEAFCYSALEGLAAGKIVIVTNIDGLPEFVHDHKNGLLISPESPQAIANALKEVIADKSLRIKLRNNGKRSCRPFFSINRMFKQTDHLYRSVF
jgi:glycosyltransferase involved in cell wall biosynthesis